MSAGPAMVVSASRRRIDPDPSFTRAFAELAPRLPGSDRQEIAALRARSLARFTELGIPTQRDEAWKFTPVGRIVNRPHAADVPAEPPLERILPHLLGGPKARRLVFVNGRLVPQWSHVGGLPEGAAIESLTRALERRTEAVAARLARDDGRSFTALNAALAASGAWIELAPGVVLSDPVQLLFVTVPGASAPMSHPRVVLRLGSGAALTLLESHVGLEPGPALTNLVLEGELGEGASLAHDRLLLQADEAALIGKVELVLGARARYDQTTVALGGSLLRSESEVSIEGEGVECRLAGLAVPRAGEHVDTLVRVHHRAPASHSDQLFKSVVEERGHHAFAGKIFVHRGAQRTNAYQKNDNLLLAEDGEVDSKPELEIYADDVKCSHGATCGELDPSALFYLRARGIDATTARGLLIWAFASELLDRLGDRTARAAARRALAARLPTGALVDEHEDAA
ncbi:MAG: Fe-S cluster assembly protein SufD [Geminicoccaceae bacterium]|nr:MAG: Fe-S cluster assembly protein SufD [Geminicoccaceae bacterium]